MKKYHYVYRITNTQENKHYYGSRSSDIHPTKDIGIKYFSSSTNKDFINEQKETPEIYKYKVIRMFDTREYADLFEIKIHKKFDVKNNKSFYNKMNAGTPKFTVTQDNHFTTNMTKEEIQLHYSKISEKNSIITKNIYDHKCHWSSHKTNDEICEIYRKSGTKQKTTKSDNIWKETQSKTLKEAFKTRNQNKANNPRAQKIEIYNNLGELMYLCNGDFLEVCKNNNLPTEQIRKSYKNNTKVYEDRVYSNSNIGQLKSNGKWKYKGWYALIKN